VTATKSLLSDYALALHDRSAEPVPIVLTFSPCGSEKTLAFMKWLGITFPRWLENDLRHAPDPLATSIALCERICAEAWEYARGKRIPLGVNVESVSIRKVEIEASVELVRRLRGLIGTYPVVPAQPRAGAEPGASTFFYLALPTIRDSLEDVGSLLAEPSSSRTPSLEMSCERWLHRSIEASSVCLPDPTRG
jgi:hypothetical protein